MLKSNSPGPVCGQRQCLVRKGGKVGLRDQRSDTPDQSAARGTTLEPMLRGKSKKGKGRAGGKKGGREGGAGNPDQSAARKTRHNTRGGQKQREDRDQREKKGADHPDL